MNVRVLIALCLFATAALATAQTQHPHRFARPTITTNPPARIPALADDPSYRRLVRNGRVEVFRLEVAPHQATLLDRHDYDYVIVSLGASHMSLEGSGSQFSLDLQDGEMQVIKGNWTHRVINTGDAPMRLIEVDVHPNIHPENPVCGLVGSSCSDGRFGQTDQGRYTYSTLFETSTVRMRKLELDGGVTLPGYTIAGDALVVALTDSDLRNPDGTRNDHVAPGAALWYGGQPGFGVANTGTATARFLVLELKR